MSMTKSESQILLAAMMYIQQQTNLSIQYLADSQSTDPRFSTTYIASCTGLAKTAFSNALKMIQWMMARASVNMQVPGAFQDADVIAIGGILN